MSIFFFLRFLLFNLTILISLSLSLIILLLVVLKHFDLGERGEIEIEGGRSG